MSRQVALEEARQILTRPKFGDTRCIEAANLLRDEAQAAELRPRVIGRRITCGPCGGRPGAGCMFCKDGLFTITAELAASWDLDIIEGVLEELRGWRG